MASMWRKAMVYLGLQDDDEGYDYDQYEGYSETDHVAAPAPRDRREYRAADHGATVRPLPREDSPTAIATSTSRPAVIRTVSAATSARVHVVEPKAFNDAQEVGDRLKANQPVILDLRGLSRELQRRLIDFSSGLAYAVGGSMSRVADQVFLLAPTNVEVSAEEKERLQARGLYQV
jgi:cell division inhibitor SepF